MKTIDSLIILQENLSEENFQEIMQIVEGLFVKDGRGDLFNDTGITKVLSKYGRKYSKKALNYVGNKIKDRVLKSNLVKNTIGKKEYESAYDALNKVQTKYNQAKQNHKNCTDDAQKRVHKEEMKFYNKEANKRAKKVNDIKQKYGL